MVLSKALDRWTCYKVYSTTLSWINAESQCKAEKGHLASIASATNNSFLQAATGNVGLSNYWFGGARDLEDGAWYWSDGLSWNYTSWAEGHPTKGPVCLAINAISGQWYADTCCKAKPFICEVSPIASSAPPLLATPPPPPRCPYGWQYLDASNLCYAFLEHERHEYSWDEAKTLCSEAGGGLASIPNRAVNDAIVTYALEAKLEDDDYWFVTIGAYYNSSTSKWEWTDGSEMHYTNWDVDKPHDSWAYKCGYLLLAYPAFGKWSNFVCNQSSMAAICERRPFDTAQGGALPPPNLPTPPPPVRCPESWQYLEATNLCYGVIEYRGIKSTNTSYWNDVKTTCSDAGGGLVSIPSKAVNDAILVLATNAKAKQEWVYLAIGAFYNNATSKWEWTDGSEMRFTNWHNAHAYTPDTHGYGYMRITPDGIGTWVMMDRVMEREYYALMCEREPFDV